MQSISEISQTMYSVQQNISSTVVNINSDFTDLSRQADKAGKDITDGFTASAEAIKQAGDSAKKSEEANPAFLRNAKHMEHVIIDVVSIFIMVMLNLYEVR